MPAWRADIVRQAQGRWEMTAVLHELWEMYQNKATCVCFPVFPGNQSHLLRETLCLRVLPLTSHLTSPVCAWGTPASSWPFRVALLHFSLSPNTRFCALQRRGPCYTETQKIPLSLSSPRMLPKLKAKIQSVLSAYAHL